MPPPDGNALEGGFGQEGRTKGKVLLEETRRKIAAPISRERLEEVLFKGLCGDAAMRHRWRVMRQATRGPLGPAYGTLPRRATSSRWRERAKDRRPGSRREPRGARVGERRGWRWTRTGQGCLHGDCGIDPRRADLRRAWHGWASPRRVRTRPDQCQGRAGNPAGAGGAGPRARTRSAPPSARDSCPSIARSSLLSRPLAADATVSLDVASVTS